jgi:hypothetical protein
MYNGNIERSVDHHGIFWYAVVDANANECNVVVE